MYTQSVYDVIRFKRSRNIRGRMRHMALNILSSWGNITGAIKRDLSKPRVHFVYLHYLFPEEEQPLRDLLTTLQETHTFISYSQAVEMVLSGRTPDRPYMCFSSDDGFKNNLRLAAILEEFDTTACFFVCSDIVSETDFETCKLFSANRLNYPPMEFLTWDELKNLKKSGHEIGCHTRWHPNLAECEPSKLYDQIGGAKQVIEEAVGKVHHFAWPYGLFKHFSSKAMTVTFKAGFTSCASAIRGAHLPESPLEHEQLCIRRDQLVAHWPMKHNLYFLAKSAKRASHQNAAFAFEN